MKPLLLHYYITNRCNSKCHFCTIWTERPKVDAIKKDVLENLKTARKYGCRFVDFTGGEPLLHEDLPEFLSTAKKLGFITSVTTNCLLFPDRANDLAGKIDLLHFSLDGDTAEVHNRIRGVDCFDAVIRSIPIALKHNLLPDLLFTYTNQNIRSFEGVYRLARKNRLMLILDPVFSTSSPDTLAAATHAEAEKYAQWPGVYLNAAHLTLRRSGGNHIRKPVCKAVTSTIVITPDNNRVYPCFHHRTHAEPAFSAPLTTVPVYPNPCTDPSQEGTYAFCEGCHINCYFDPSYNYQLNRLFFQSLRSKLAYIIMKYFIYRHFRHFLRLYYAR